MRRNLRYPIFEVFDRPDSNQSCPQRNESTIAPQALTLLNSEFALTAAKMLAGRVLNTSGPEPARQVAACYRRVLGRPPTAEESAIAVRFLSDDALRLRKESPNRPLLVSGDHPLGKLDRFHVAALTDFCRVLFNLNEFVYVD